MDGPVGVVNVLPSAKKKPGQKGGDDADLHANQIATYISWNRTSLQWHDGQNESRKGVDSIRYRT